MSYLLNQTYWSFSVPERIQIIILGYKYTIRKGSGPSVIQQWLEPYLDKMIPPVDEKSISFAI